VIFKRKDFFIDNCAAIDRLRTAMLKLRYGGPGSSATPPPLVYSALRASQTQLMESGAFGKMGGIPVAHVLSL
jgi:hypothetical protein